MAKEGGGALWSEVGRPLGGRFLASPVLGFFKQLANDLSAFVFFGDLESARRNCIRG